MTMTNDPTTQHEHWTKAAEAYQKHTGEMTKIAAARIVELSEQYLPFEVDSYVLDVGCGGGSLPIKVNEKYPNVRILATDISTGMLEKVDALNLSNVTTQKEDATTLDGLQDESFTHVFTLFTIQFSPDQPECVNQLYRVLKPGGYAGIVIWGETTAPTIIHNTACRRIKPDYQWISTRPAESYSKAKVHEQKMKEAGFINVETEIMHLRYGCISGEDFNRHWYTIGNPVTAKLVEHATQQGIELDELKHMTAKITDEEYDHGRGVVLEAVLGYGMKAE